MDVNLVTAVVAVLALVVSAATLVISSIQQYKFSGAMAAIAWRDQVFALHDRGLTAEQIRAIMLAESGGEGYEAGNGSIDTILKDLPRPER